jgi:DNA (cytosine-5)-methyltransferase 1
MQKLKTLDLFAGIGGFSLGLERTGGFETAAFCEIDKKAQLVLRKHWPNVPIFEDVSELSKEKLDAEGVNIDVITGGFPCQDISLAGKGAGLEGERSGLWFQFHRLIKEIQPRYALIENVSALRSRGLDTVLRGLSEIGYDAEWHCIPASAVGAPHRRDRVWIVAYPNGSGPYASALPGVHQGEAGAGARDGEPERLRGALASGAVADAQHSAGWAVDPGGCGVGRAHNGVCGRQEATGRIAERSSPVADSVRSRRSAGIPAQGYGQEGVSKIADHLGDRLGRWTGGDYWSVEPDVGRVAHGVPNRVDRLKQLGNAVVPQIPQLLGHAILAREGIAS